MTATTTIRLDDELKARVAEAASRAGQTAHAFMLDAIAQTVEQAEHEAAFHQIADDRWAQQAETGETVAWDDARIWLQARARGEQPARPTARAHKN